MILLDTNVLSELMKPVPDLLVERWFLLNEEDCCLASVVIGELAFGIGKLDDGARKSNLQSQLFEWRIRFVNRSHPFDVAAAMIYGEVQANARKAGRSMSVPDAQIAAIARDKNFSLATRNAKDFSTTGLDLINPWLP